jgi:hypothetical protein
LKAVGDGGIATECFGYVWIGIGRGGTSRGGWPWRDYFENLHLRIVRMPKMKRKFVILESCVFQMPKAMN